MGQEFGDNIRHGDMRGLIDSLERIESSNAKISDNALLMAMLAEHQDALDEAVDKATIEYLHAQEFARNMLQALRDAIDLRDAMSNARKYVGGAQ